jgi:hypothetical protein
MNRYTVTTRTHALSNFTDILTLVWPVTQTSGPRQGVPSYVVRNETCGIASMG